MMRTAPTTLLFLLLLATFLAACRSAAPEPMPEDFQIALERSPCFGTCPVYKLTVSADGQLAYEGIQFVEVEGRQTAKLSEDGVTALYNAVQSARFFSLNDAYEVSATDLPAITLTVTAGGRTKSVFHYGLRCGSDRGAAPRELCELEALVESIPVSNGWVSPN